jgi:hypothetical protein
VLYSVHADTAERGMAFHENFIQQLEQIANICDNPFPEGNAMNWEPLNKPRGRPVPFASLQALRLGKTQF